MKMHGAGNDFVIIDTRHKKLKLKTKQIREIANRRYGVGCDQILLLESTRKADIFMRVFNSDGGEIGACGNATRCVAALMMDEKKKDTVKVETVEAVMECTRAGKHQVTVNMGKPRLYWKEIPLAKAMDTEKLSITAGGMQHPVAVSMGNPHMVFFVPNVSKVPLDKLGPKLEHHKLYPKRTNVSVVEILKENHIIQRVWERGAGETLACGTAACAAVVAGARRGLTKRKVKVELPGGKLTIEWRPDDGDVPGEVLMNGPVSHVFHGELEL
jgi:diaminopimelate epimerase